MAKKMIITVVQLICMAVFFVIAVSSYTSKSATSRLIQNVVVDSEERAIIEQGGAYGESAVGQDAIGKTIQNP